MSTLNVIDWKLLKKLFFYIKQRKILVFLAFICLIIANIASAYYPYLFKVGIDQYVSQTFNLKALIDISYLFLTVLIIHFIFQVFFTYIIEYVGQLMLYDMRIDIYKKILFFSKSYFDKTPVGQTLTNLTNDVEAIRQFISEGIVNIIGDVLKIIIILFFMAYINWRLALITSVVIPIFIIATLYFRSSIRSGYRGVRQANSDINRHMVESLTGIKEIKMFNAQKLSIKEFNSHNQSYLTSFLKIVKAYSLYFPIIDLISNIVLILIICFMHFYLNIFVKIGDIYAYYAYMNMIFFPLRNMAEKMNAFQSAMAASERVFKLLEKKSEIISPTHPINLPLNIKGEIKFKNVSFYYEKNNFVLKKINLNIQSGEKVAIVGHTGSGKSTIINLINRFYNVQKGQVLIDKIDIRNMALHDLRKIVTMVPQDPFLFTGTIKDNITLFDETISEKKIINVCKKINLHHFIESLPHKYNNQIAEEGKSFSGGQKQLISFARALLVDSPIILLDEATSGLDSKSEKTIEKAINKLFYHKSGIIIAHRLSTIKSVDRIIVLDKGEIIEEGTHEALIRNNSLYKKLYNLQVLAQSITKVA